MRLAKLILQGRFTTPPILLTPAVAIADAIGNPELKKQLETQTANALIERYLFNVEQDHALFGIDRTNAGVDIN